MHGEANQRTCGARARDRVRSAHFRGQTHHRGHARADHPRGAAGQARRTGKKPRAEGPGALVLRWYLGRSVSCGDRPLTPVEQEVETNLEDALGFLHVEEEGPGAANEAGRGSAHDVVAAGPEVVEVVLDEAGYPVGEGVFTADANRPPAASVAETDGQPRESKGQFIPFPGNAAFHITEEAVPPVADTTGQRGNRLDAIGRGQVRKYDAGPIRRGVGPVVVPLHADHEPTGELIVAASLNTGSPTIEIRASGTPVRTRSFFADPNAADVAADIAAGPGKDDRRWRRRRSLVDRRP